MSLKAKDLQKAQLKKWLQTWRRRLLLNEWYFNLDYPLQDVGMSDDRSVLCEVSVDPVYLKANIKVFPAWFTRSKDVREHALVHEMCHCFTQEVWNLMDSQHNGVTVHAHMQRDSIERLTQRITNAVFWTGPKE